MSREEKAPDDAESKLRQDLLDHKTSLSALDRASDVPEAQLVEQNVVGTADSFAETSQNNVVNAVLVESAILAETAVMPELVDPGNEKISQLQATPPRPRDMDNVAAVGGAVGAIVLGTWSLIGIFVTPWTVINSVLGILLGIWGISSRHRRLALIGILLCLASGLLCLVQASGVINELLTPIPDENV